MERNNLTRLLSAKDLAAYLGIGRDKAYALIKAPFFPAIQIGSRYVVEEEALIEWLRNNRYKKIAV